MNTYSALILSVLGKVMRSALFALNFICVAMFILVSLINIMFYGCVPKDKDTQNTCDLLFTTASIGSDQCLVMWGGGLELVWSYMMLPRNTALPIALHKYGNNSFV